MADIFAPLRPAMHNESLRYLLAVVIGLMTDMAVSYALRTQFDLSTMLSALAGFCCGVLVNYVNFEKWVFGKGSLSWMGLFRIFAAAQSALAVRLAAVWILTKLALATLLVFGLAISVTFAVNFFLSRWAIKKKASAGCI
jgi:putative flippase GtrA